jgi:hypothetical protein
MKIPIDKKKYRKRLLSLYFLTLSLSFSSIMFVIINMKEHKPFEWTKVGILIFLLLLLSLFAYLLSFYSRLSKRREHVIELENGILNDYSKPFHYASSLDINNIKSISFWRETKGILQFKIVTKEENVKDKGLINQLNRKHFYITDYIVETEQLKSLVNLIEKEIN